MPHSNDVERQEELEKEISEDKRFSGARQKNYINPFVRWVMILFISFLILATLAIIFSR